MRVIRAAMNGLQFAATIAPINRSNGNGAHGQSLDSSNAKSRTRNHPPEREAQARRGLHISVIVPVHNGTHVTGRCHRGPKPLDLSNFEVIVVDDCSTDTTPQIVERYRHAIYSDPEEYGPGRARNLGSKHASGEILAFIDADVILPPEGLCLVEEAFSRDPKLAAVFGSYDDEPECDTFVSQ